MEKKALSVNPSQQQEEYPPSDIQQADQCITFISLSHYQMHKLVHDTQSFVNKIKSINRQAKKQIDLGAFKEALTLLTQGEKILEYAAGSGKTIERDLIICILHNIAATYHKLWILGKCLRYVEGLIFNLENHLHSLQNSVVSSSQQHQFIAACHNLDIQKMLAVYNLRYCALSSLEQNHKDALVSAKKAIGYMRGILTFDQQYTKNMFKQQKQLDSKIDLKHRLLIQILEYESTMNVRKQKDILKAAHFSIQLWDKQKSKHTNNQRYNFLKTYSIGDFMDFMPLQYHSKKQQISLQEQNSKQFEDSIVFKLLLLSISYFSTANEIRLTLAGGHNQYYSQIQRQSGCQFIQSQIYHLLAIIVITAFLPFEILYLKHVLNNYSNYFNSGLLEYKTVQTQSFQKIIELVSDNNFKSPYLGSTQIISSEEMLPDTEDNEYKLTDRFKDKVKNPKKNQNRYQKQGEKPQSKKSRSKNFSSLDSKSIIKQEKKSKPAVKADSKLKDKTKSKQKPKSKTLQKKSRDKEKYMYLKVANSKPKKRHLQDEASPLCKKVSPKKPKEHAGLKQIFGSQITKQRKKSILNHRVPSTKRILNENRSPRRRNNIYGFKY